MKDTPINTKNLKLITIMIGTVGVFGLACLALRPNIAHAAPPAPRLQYEAVFVGADAAGIEQYLNAAAGGGWRLQATAVGKHGPILIMVK